MVKTMTPLTQGQIGKICDLLSAGLRKSGLPSEATQQVIETQGEALAAELVAVVCKRVEAISNIIVRHVRVDRSRAPQQVLDATGRRQYVDRNVVDAMPKGEGNEKEVYFFRLNLADRGGNISDDDLEKEFDSRGFKPADPHTLAKVNEDDSVFADTHPNGTHWKDTDGKWCYMAFDLWFVKRHVYVNRYAHNWFGNWWFAGLRK